MSTQTTSAIPDPIDPGSDAALALWLADRLRNELVWVGGFGWLKRAGDVWVPEPQALTVVSDHLRARIPSLARMGYNPRRINAVESSKVAADVERLLRGRLQETGVFDADPYLLNCPNGVVELRTGELRDHLPSDRFLRSTAVPYLPGHSSELWDAALQSLPSEVLDWLQVRLGHATTAHPPPDDRVLLLIGTGDNGKSTLIDGMVAALGGYASTVSERVLTARQGDHPTELMDLMDLRVAVLEELPGGRYLNVGRLKLLTGTRNIKARRMREDSATFLVTYSLFITSNYSPKIVETDHGTWRRLVCVGFPYIFTDDPRPDSHERLKREEVRVSARAGDPAALAWLVEGARRALAPGGRRLHNTIPANVAEFTDRVRADNNTIQQFLDECTATGVGKLVPVVFLYSSYREWMHQRGFEVPSMSVFADRLHEVLPLEKARKRFAGRQCWCYLGLELIEPELNQAHFRANQQENRQSRGQRGRNESQNV